MGPDEAISAKFVYPTIKDKDSLEAKILLAVARGEKEPKAAWEVLQTFPILMRWYDFIAEGNKGQIFMAQGTREIRADDAIIGNVYWLGQELFVKDYDFTSIHEYFINNFPQFRNGSAPKIPQGVQPHHNIYVDTYGIASNPDASDEEIAACRLIPAATISKNTAVSNIDGKEMKYENPYGYDLRSHLVLMHQGIVCKIVDAGVIWRFEEYEKSRLDE